MRQCPFDGLCGDIGMPSKYRSFQQHKRFFSIVNAAFQNWPESEDFQPDNPLHLRKWLTCKAGWRFTMSIENPNFAERAATVAIAVLHQRGEPAWIVEDRGRLHIISARSIAYSDMSHKKACEYFGKAEGIVCDILKFENGDALLKAAENARAA